MASETLRESLPMEALALPNELPQVEREALERQLEENWSDLHLLNISDHGCRRDVRIDQRHVERAVAEHLFQGQHTAPMRNVARCERVPQRVPAATKRRTSRSLQKAVDAALHGLVETANKICRSGADSAPLFEHSGEC